MGSILLGSLNGFHYLMLKTSFSSLLTWVHFVFLPKFLTGATQLINPQLVYDIFNSTDFSVCNVSATSQQL